MKSAPRIAVIGLGAMADSLIEQLKRHSPDLTIAAALIRQASTARAADVPTLFDTVGGLIGWQPDLVVECAGHAAVRSHAPALLAAGIDMIIASVGVLGDADFARSLVEAAGIGRSRLRVPVGAVGGLDALRAARLGGIEHVRYIGRKPPLAWTGTPAEDGRDLAALRSQEPVFTGNASEAVRLFPKNANVTAAIALAGIGFERTMVTLIADSAIALNQHEIEAEGSFGRFRIVLENRPLAGNPKTSELAALSVAQAVISHFQTVDFEV